MSIPELFNIRHGNLISSKIYIVSSTGLLDVLGFLLFTMVLTRSTQHNVKKSNSN